LTKEEQLPAVILILFLASMTQMMPVAATLRIVVAESQESRKPLQLLLKLI
jgi:hypothetical protein